MDILRLEMTERRKHWENQMSAITARGELEWSAGERRFNREYKEWVGQTSRRYERQKEAWDEKYLDFISDKDQWLDAVTIQSTKNGDMKVLENFGEMTSGAIAAAGTDIIVTELHAPVNPDEILKGPGGF